MGEGAPQKPEQPFVVGSVVRLREGVDEEMLHGTGYELVPGRDYIVLLPYTNGDGSRGAYVGPANMSEQDIREFNEDLVGEERYLDVDCIRVEYLERAPKN